jgi:polysaccharide biosynthesis protein VpsQ
LSLFDSHGFTVNLKPDDRETETELLAIRWYVWVFFSGLTGIIVIADLGLAPILFPFIRTVPYIDKFSHFFLMGGLSFVLNMSLSGHRISLLSRSAQTGTVVVLILVTLEECSQLFLSHRKFDPIDLIWSILGAVVFGMLASAFLLRNKSGRVSV